MRSSEAVMEGDLEEDFVEAVVESSLAWKKFSNANAVSQLLVGGTFSASSVMKECHRLLRCDKCIDENWLELTVRDTFLERCTPET